VATLGEVIASIRSALDRLAQARQALVRAGTLLDEADQTLAHALAGSRAPEGEQALAFLVVARADINDAHRELIEAESRAQSYLNRLGATSSAGTPAATASPTPAPTVTSGTVPTSEPTALSRERIEQLRAELPPDILPPDQRPQDEPRRRTHGRWIGPDGQARPITSGEDELYAESVKAFPALGLRRGLPRRASDVEMKLAAYIRNRGIRSAIVVINNTPCPGPYGCDELVPVLLPEGCTLTVHGPNNFTKTYRGGATPPWSTR
jgi:hypothetical protein